jgi:antitoxin (DNA-binding transcriptional repressor) of toxin-antitoxin stability system
MAVIHISESEAERDFAGLLARVRSGDEVVIESDSAPVKMVPAIDFPRRTISESIAMARARTAERGYAAVMDDDFAADMEEIIRNRKPADRSAWD